LIYQRTDGNPLFMVSVVDYLVARGLLVQQQERWELTVELGEIEVGVPEGIQQMIEKQIEQLRPEEQRVLEAASTVGVGGAEFSTVAVAAALEADVVQIEEQIEALGRRQQFLRSAGISEFPDGTVSARYQFIHTLYQNVLYERIAAGRRMRLHLNTAMRGEEIYGDQIDEIVGEIWMHCERGRDYRRAVKYLAQAAEKAARRYANREAISHLTRALELVERLPETEATNLRLSVLEQRGRVRRSGGDMKGSAEEFEALARCAREQGQVDKEVKALLLLSSVLFWVDRERCLAAVEQAAALSHYLQDELLRAHTRGYCGHWNLNLRGWRDEDAEAFVEALQAARRANHRALLSLYLVRNAYHQCMRSDYEAACRAAEEGMQLALEVGDAFDYLVGKFFWAWALLHRGQWREMRHVLGQGMEMAQKNGHHLWTMLFQIEVAWLHQQAFDFERARELCEPVLQHAQAAPQETGQLLFKSLLVLGLTHLGLEDYERAFDCFSEMTRQLQRPDMVMDWILNMPLQYGLSEYWLAQGDPDRARQEAERLCELAALPGERTYLALGRRTLAEIALAERNWDQAQAELSQALAVLEGGEAPLAAWRVYATAARFHDQRRRKADAKRDWAQSAAVLNRLADSLGDDAELRQSLLTHPTVQAIFRHARPQGSDLSDQT
jgi:tetratricopeptide (TPR) repeat protein